MRYYAIEATTDITLPIADSYVCSEEELNEFDILLMDTADGFIACMIKNEIKKFEAMTKPFEIKRYLSKTNVEDTIKMKQVQSYSQEIISRCEARVKEIQMIEKLRKYANNPEIKDLLEQYDTAKAATNPDDLI